ncbi:MAG: NAD-dependent epimerase/dehydratase family protein [Proteobacteria bacterium]|nr:NAD-dependent epimerase/dehydratase family protein [Pseudomonadota bacterium]
MKFLVTGGAGFIGSHLVHRLQSHAPVHVLDNLTTGRRDRLVGSGCRLFEGSILDRTLLAEAVQGVTHIFHLAAMVSVSESVAQPSACEQTNVEGTRQVLEAASKAGAKRFVLASSCAIYGNDPKTPKNESLPPAPASPYAESKLAGEKMCAASAVPAVALRFFNVYGPGQDPHGPYAAAIPSFFQSALSHTPITIHGDGKQTRDFVFVEDVTAALFHAALHPDLGGVYNVASGQSTSILQLAQKIISLTGSSSTITHTPERPGDVRFSSASIERIRATGWAPRAALEEGLTRLMPKN